MSPDRPAAGPRGWTAGLVVVATIVALHAPSFSLPFFQDDYFWLNPAASVAELVHPVVGQIAIGPRLVWTLLVWTLGVEPAAHHVAYALACGALGLLVRALLERLGVARSRAVPAAVLAAGHPAAAFGYLWLSCWGHLLATMGLVAAALAVVSGGPVWRRSVMASVAVAVAMVSKESAVCGVVVLPLVALATTDRRAALRAVVVPVLLLGGVALVRLGALTVAPGALGTSAMPNGAPGWHPELLPRLAGSLTLLAWSPLTTLAGLGALAGRRVSLGLSVIGLAAVVLTIVVQPGVDPLEGGDLIDRMWIMSAVWLAGALTWLAEPFARMSRARSAGVSAVLALVAGLGAVELHGAADRLAAQTSSQLADIAALDAAAARGAPVEFAGWANDQSVLLWYLRRARERGQPVEPGDFVRIGPDGARSPWLDAPAR